MATYLELRDRMMELAKQMEEARLMEMGEAIREVRRLIEVYELTPQDIFDIEEAMPGEVPNAKYRDPETGDTWSGKGRPPRWIIGKDREQFLIKRAERNVMGMGLFGKASVSHSELDEQEWK